MQFPQEEWSRDVIEQECGDLIKLAKRVLSSWTTINRSDGYQRSALSPEVKNAAYALDIRLCRQFRSVIELCTRGEARDATVLSRVMFENLLALEFVLRPRISLKPYRRRGRKSNPPSSMPRLLRARLYWTYYGLRWEVLRSRNDKKPGAKRHTRQLASQVPKDVLDHYESLIGSEWVERFKRSPRTYSGLSVSELAQAIDPMYARWYSIIYAIQSDAVHASNAADVLHSRDTPWHDAPGDVEAALRLALDIFLAAADLLHKHIRFRSAAGMLLDGLEDQYGRIKDDRRKR